MHPLEDKDFIRKVRRHFVPLTGRYLILDEAGNETGKFEDFGFSAFVIEVLGRWCLITAGHVIDRIDEIAKHPLAKLTRTGFADYFSEEAKAKETTYFDWGSTHKIHVDIDNVMDFAVIPIIDFYTESMKANGVTPLPVSNWSGHSPPVSDHYALLGIPDELTRPADHPRGGKSVLLTMIPLLAHKLPPQEHVVSNIPRFAATLHHGGELQSPKGMSGGPMIGINTTPTGLTYSCIAIQGSCDVDDKSLVFGTPLAIIVKHLEQLLFEEVARRAKLN